MSRKPVLTRIVLAALLAAGAQPACAAPPPELSFEQLLNTEVSGVSKAQERLLDAPASVSIITAEQIRAFGLRTLADIATLARGFYAYSDRLYGYAGVRGFAPVGDFNTRVLLLIDGYPANDNVFEQAALGTEAIIDPELIERVEVIRGPSSSIYGTNAFLGVINVITKAASRVDPGVQVGLGSGGHRGLGAALSGSVGESLRYLLRVSRSRSDGLDVEFGERPGLPGGLRLSGVSGEQLTRVFAKVVAGNLAVSVGHSDRRQDSGFGLYGADVGDPQAYARDAHSFANLRYEAALADATDLALRASFGSYRYRDRYVFAGDASRLAGYGDWAGTEATLTQRLAAGHRLVAGAELRRDLRADLLSDGDSLGQFLDVRSSGNRFALYAQHDIDWTAHWSTSAGLRYDRYAGGEQASPRGALLYKPSRAATFKLMAGSAFRAANVNERLYEIAPSFIANPSLKAERIRTVDLEYEGQLDEATRVAVTAFRYHAHGLITSVVDEISGALQYRNQDDATAHGLDFTVEHQFTAALRARASGSFAKAENSAGERLANSPRFAGRAGAIWKAWPGWQVGAEAVHAGSRLTDQRSRLPSYTVANVTLTSTPRRRGFDFSFSVYNLFDRAYAQPWQGSGAAIDDRVGQQRRTWRIDVGYAF